MDNSYVIGVDFGTDSVRALVVDCLSGKELATAVAPYKRWMKGLYCNASQNRFRQHPLDYLEGLEECITGALSKVSQEIADKVVGIGIDTTGSTPCAVDDKGRPLALLDEFQENPNAMFVLWKDHTAVQEAQEINEVARTWGGTDFTKYEGGVYSSEWFWAKILHVLREDPKVRASAHSWVEHCDWIPAVLTGTEQPHQLKRSRCAAGHKAMWHTDWDGLPPEDFLTKVDPLLKGLRERLYTTTYTSDNSVGGLTKTWAKRLGLPPNVAVAVGAFDSHMGAVGGGITHKTLVKIMGTSTCDMMIAEEDVIGDNLVSGICGQVDGSVIPGMIGLEAGQSAFGDAYAWFRQLLIWPIQALADQVGLDESTKQKMVNGLLQKLTEEAEQVDPGDSTVLALDWLNGRRTPYADQRLKGAFLGLSLGTDAPKMFRALVESTVYGAKAIVDRFREEGVEIEQVIAQGGIPNKNPFVMQVTADVFNMPIKVVRSEQACALGAAMFGAVAANVYPDVNVAQQAMSSGFSQTFTPNPERAQQYRKLYEKYLQTGELLADTLRSL